MAYMLERWTTAVGLWTQRSGFKLWPGHCVLFLHGQDISLLQQAPSPIVLMACVKLPQENSLITSLVMVITKISVLVRVTILS